jgi:transposase
METVTLNTKQQRRARIIAGVSAGSISKTDAENLLGLSRRQINRALKAYDERGLASVVHGNSGRSPSNKTDQVILDKIKQLTGEGGKYEGFNTCHLHDMLMDCEEMTVGRSTISRALRDGKQAKPNRKDPIKRRRRQRSSAEGRMLQIDGSPHDWLEGRGPKMTLVGAVDDATSKIIYLRFRPTEDAVGYLMMMRETTLKYGLPESFYHDRHTILRSPKEPTIEDELAGRLPASQLQRIMEELGVESIAAHSPQAKGRIERLWGVLQDRLVKEMRLADISSIEDANAFLDGFIERYNTKFSVPPADPNAVWVQIESDFDADYYFSLRESRVVKSDHTISWFGSTIQIRRGCKDASLAGKRVNVHTTPEGKCIIYDKKTRLKHRIIKQRPRPSVNVEESKQMIDVNAPESDLRASVRKRGWLFGKTPAEAA